MKKYLMTGISAIIMSGLFTSCSHDMNSYIGDKTQEIKQNYENAFVETFGQPAATQTWGFGPSTVAGTRGGTRSLGDYDEYKGTMQPVEWYQDTNDNWAWKTRTYTFPSALEIPTTKPNDAQYYEGGYKYFNGETIWMDENTSKHVEVQGYCDMYIVKTGTGEANVIIESTDKWYVGNVPYGSGKKIRVFVCPGVTLKIPAKDEQNLQANVEYYFAPGSDLICNELKLNGTVFYMGASTTTTVSKLEVNNSGIFYNMGTANITNDISVENSSSTIVNDGTLNAANLLTKGSGRVENNAELTISNTTTINSNYNVWVNNGYYKTKNFEYTATSASVINNCFLEVTENFFMNIADGSGDFKIDAGGGVLTKNFYGGGVYGSYNGGPYKITMGSRSVFKVTNEAHLNALASGIATAHYGFEGVGSDYAVFQANKVIRDGLGEGNVAYGGKLYVSAEEHFAQGYSGQYPYIHYYDDCSEANIYAPGFQSGTPDITINTTPCNPGFNVSGDDDDDDDDEGGEGGGNADEIETVRVIAEDLTLSDYGKDFDFNDVVFDVIWNKTQGKVSIKVLAAGGELTMYIGGTADGVDGVRTVNDYFARANEDKNITEKTMINTAPGRHNEYKTFEYELDNSWWSGNTIGQIAKSIYIRVMKSGELVTLSADQGKAASKIAVGTDYEWCDEREDVDDKFGGKFSEYVGGAHSWNTWYK